MTKILDMAAYRQKQEKAKVFWSSFGSCWFCAGQGATYKAEQICEVCGAHPKCPSLKVTLQLKSGITKTEQVDTGDASLNKALIEQIAKSQDADVIDVEISKQLSR